MPLLPEVEFLVSSFSVFSPQSSSSHQLPSTALTLAVHFPVRLSESTQRFCSDCLQAAGLSGESHI